MNTDQSENRDKPLSVLSDSDPCYPQNPPLLSSAAAEEFDAIVNWRRARVGPVRSNRTLMRKRATLSSRPL